MKKMTAIMACAILLFGCATSNSNGPGPESGIKSALNGIAHFILSPIQIAAGLLEGISSLPWFLSMSVHEINKGMAEAQARITLDDTYESAYGKRLSEVADDGETGEVFRRMKHATVYFQKVLKQHGLVDYQNYILTSIDTASSEGYTLFAVVHRPHESIVVADKYKERMVRTFTKDDRLFYEPFEKDSHGRSLDTIIDWAGVPRDTIQTQKAQAVFITMAANAILNKKRSPDYWEVERRWIAGEYKEIAEQKMNNARKEMGV